MLHKWPIILLIITVATGAHPIDQLRTNQLLSGLLLLLLLVQTCELQCMQSLLETKGDYRATDSNDSTTPERSRSNTHIEDQIQRLQMTDPDEQHQRQNETTTTTTMLPQPNFWANLEASIPQVVIPSSLNAPRQFSMPAQSQPQARPSTSTSFVGLGAPFEETNALLVAIPQVQLPDGWDAPLQNPIPIIPPHLQLQPRNERGRGRRGRGRGTEHNSVDPVVQQQQLQQAIEERRAAEIACKNVDALEQQQIAEAEANIQQQLQAEQEVQ